jgi:cell division inhibitor SulA
MNVQALLQHPDLWRAGQIDRPSSPRLGGVKTGYTQLDAQLPGNGWPSAGLMELLLANAGIGELRLLAPALRQLSEDENRWMAWINPPFIPYAPALEALGINLQKMLMIHPKTHKDTLWALERAVKSGSCSSLLAWVDEKKLTLKDTQRLQVAAKQGRTLTCLFRPQHAAEKASMAPLRIALHAGKPGIVQLDILKRRGSWPLHNLQLSIAQVTGTQYQSQTDMAQQLALWRLAKREGTISVRSCDEPELTLESNLQKTHSHAALLTH